MNLKQPELLWYGISEKYCKKSKIPYNITISHSQPKLFYLSSSTLNPAHFGINFS
jgi:hypothetical protein